MVTTMIVGRNKRNEWDRQIECRDRAIAQVNHIFDYAIKDQLTHSQILERLNTVYTEEFKRRLTIAQKEYVRGYVTCRFDRIWREHIAWGFKPRGVFVANFDDVLKDYHDVVEADACNGFHYWKTSNGEKPFTLPEGR